MVKMLGFTKTDEVLDLAKEQGWKAEYDELCGVCTTVVGQITLTKKDCKTVRVGVRCAVNQGLVFDRKGSTYPSLWRTADALGV